MLTILGHAVSINVRKVLWTCAELDLEYTLDAWGGTSRSTSSPSFLALNPNATVPVLRDGDLVLWESNTICRYLAARYGDGALLPTAPGPRAQVEQWMDWQATDLNSAWRYAFMHLVRRNPAFSDAAAAEASAQEWNRRMTILDGQLAHTGAYVAGAEFSLADIVIGLSVNRWLLSPIARPELAAVAAYHERLLQRPGYAAHGANGLP
ncbi:glutathione S-transferase family protein [Duganella sp. LX20W]|uniref:Glutathione S-transferase family protein n=1 Tax=Rugamonas brunnea TaxID=2758569 RepID=A0A7W2EVE0_9BURK|nr:glutathione S-transferase family protein [Rugamonas brunnea]MBA5639317.1 glutathione S-transferase family protein [Rugamonas brunnea]